MIPVIPSDLKQEILSLDGKGYKAYKSLQGKSFDYDPFTIRFEHVQGDSFAQPTCLSISIGVEAKLVFLLLYSITQLEN